MQTILSQLAHAAASATGSGDTEHVRILTERSGSIKDSELIPGIVLVKARVHREMEMKAKPGRILILDGGMEKRKPEIEANLKITSLGAIDAFNARDTADLQARVDALKAANIDCLVARDGIEEAAHAVLAAAGILA